MQILTDFRFATRNAVVRVKTSDLTSRKADSISFVINDACERSKVNVYFDFVSEKLILLLYVYVYVPPTNSADGTIFVRLARS